MSNLKFSLVLKELPVKLTGAAGVEKSYVLKELTGIQRDKFLNEMGKRLKFEDGKIQQVTDFEGLQSNLLTLCLYDENDSLIPINTLQIWPAGVLTELFKAAQNISGLDLTEEEMAKLKNG